MKSKKELEFAIKADLMMNRGKSCWTHMDRIKHILWSDYIMLFLKIMRKVQFFSCQKGLISVIMRHFYLFRYNKIQMKLGFSILANSIGYGLVIPHYGTIVGGGNR